MAALREILERHGRVLVLDAAGLPQAAWWEGASWAAGQEEGDAGVGLFRAIERLGVDPGQAEAFVFCSGPGSVLGIRTCAIAIRTWNALRPRCVYHYDGLDLLAAANNAKDVAYIADARRGLWHWRGGSPRPDVDGSALGNRAGGPGGNAASAGDSATAAGQTHAAADKSARLPGAMAERIPANEVRRRALERGLTLATPSGFKAWERLDFDGDVQRVPYDLGVMLKTGAGAFFACDEPDAALLAAPAYVTWTPAIHRGPAAKA